MKKIISFILASIVALGFSITVANSAAKEVRVAFFLEWPTPNQEDKVKGLYEKALGVPVKWTNFTNGGAMTDAMLAGDIDISYSQGLVPFINAVKSKAPLKLVDIAMEYGMGGTTCVTSNASGITKANASELEGKKVAVPLGTMAEYVFDESMKVVGADRGKMEVIQMNLQNLVEKVDNNLEFLIVWLLHLLFLFFRVLMDYKINQSSRLSFFYLHDLLNNNLWLQLSFLAFP